jgi:hypothetical protein
LLLAPRPSQADAPGAAPTAASPAGSPGTAAPGDLSPRADKADGAATDPTSPLPDPAVVGLPRDVSLAELFPAEAAMGASPAAGQPGTVPAIQAGHIGEDAGRGAPNRVPLIAGIVVTLAILFIGGGFLWWRNRDTAYWPA